MAEAHYSLGSRYDQSSATPIIAVLSFKPRRATADRSAKNFTVWRSGYRQIHTDYSDVFISHAHIDHIGGFLWLLRSRIGNFPSCRLFGPPGLIGHVKGMIDGVLWDRIGDTGPRFEIAEIHGNRLLRTRIQTGYQHGVDLPELQITEGLIVDDPLFYVRTATLDHGTPVQAYAFESKAKFNVDNTDLKLVPFHFSRRYETRPETVYLEISEACSRVMMPWK